jgi:hypothetical protein
MLFCFPGCFMLIRREAFARLEGFNEEFTGWGFEDTDFAVRAIRALHVLNLFRSCEPLLHIDHPVSPYKSEEHDANFRKFYGSADAVDVHRFCRTVFTGNDFGDGRRQFLDRRIHSRPFEELSAGEIPLDPAELEEWIAGVAGQLMRRFASPLPEFIVLHGSRAAGSARPESDYDLLCLYEGAIQEFFATRSSPKVEIECASLEAFGAIAKEPWHYDLRGALDIAKLAQARLLWGNEHRWLAWRSRQTRRAVRNGWAFWLTLGVGLLLSRDKHGAALDRFCLGLREIAHAVRLPEALEGLATLDLNRLEAPAAKALDAEMPNWQTAVRRQQKVFPLQVPEVWSALYWLASGTTLPDQVLKEACEANP